MLQSRDYDKMLQFIVNIQPDNGNYRKTVLDQLKNFYGYSHMTFFIADNAGNLGNPIASNITDYFLEIYGQYFYKVDMFHTVNIPSKMLQKKVVSVTDLMSYNQFVNTEYYNDFFKKMNLDYQVILPLIIDEKMLGVIGVFKSKDQGEFTQKELLVFNNINRHIAYNFKTSRFIKSIQNEGFLYKTCSHQAPLGILVMAQDLKPVYFNEEGSRICMDITSCNSIEASISMVSRLILERITNRLFDGIFVCNAYQIRIIPQIIPNACGEIETVYIIYMNKNEKPIEKVLDKIREVYSFSNREKEIIEQIYGGLSNEEIAEKLFISIHTVKTHIENIYRKMGINKRTSLFNIINEISCTI